MVTRDRAILFVNPEQVNDTVKKHLGSTVEIRPYDSFFPYLKEFGSSLQPSSEPVRSTLLTPHSCVLTSNDSKFSSGKELVWLLQKLLARYNPPKKTKFHLLNFIQGKSVIASSPVTDLKAIKNETEIEGFRQCHIRDGVALARYFSWLQEQLEQGVELNESQGADQLEKYRS